MLVCCGLGACQARGAALEQQRQPSTTGDARVDRLLERMTLQEKLALIHEHTRAGEH